MSTSHISRTAGNSQCARILAMLEAQRGQWVDMPALYRASGSMAIHSRIADLRKRGHDIAQRNLRQPSGAIHSQYRLSK